MDGDACELTLTFDTPQDLSEMRVALWKGDQRTRSIDVLVDGALDGTFVSSGTTTDYETYDLVVAQVNEVVLQAVDIADNGWLSVTGVLFMTDDGDQVESTPSPGSQPTPSPQDTESTPAPAPQDDNSLPALFDCPDGSTRSSLEIVMEELGRDQQLHVREPGGRVVDLWFVGDVGGKGYFNNDVDSPYQTYLLFNGLNVDSDPVLGTYEVTVQRGFSDDPFKVTALVDGEVVWVEEGTLDNSQKSPVFEVTLAAYAESDCSIDAYDECPSGSYSPDGNPPCELCLSEEDDDGGVVGATTCNATDGDDDGTESTPAPQSQTTSSSQDSSSLPTLFDCPDGSTRSSLEIVLEEQGNDQQLHVLEPGGSVVDLWFAGDVGGKGYYIDRTTDTPYQTYLLFNGLDVDSDEVLGTYSVTVERGFSGDPFKVTALVDGEVVWVEEGTLDGDGDSPMAFEVELTAYAESDCSIDVYDECPNGSYSPDGNPPCELCLSEEDDDGSRVGATTCDA
ncbi:unnamed protein product [Sphacelaria rigidula]